ncbi:hypothetical protein G6O67_003907 [Ophiocordyceps sinensis]|uniref:DUF3824 domain-containing protein n=3 Tax=Ophiocordyceps sinensis TaxID=72228 RepID=A0A8H4PSS1_9HYPO|nr:hypothetical protein OCS_06475 [Ophiocordyceps sinensis CO18]KAF4509768.1 hypothetical protein G6O67_003907 [Ophiocordyceps sinensis]
MANYDPYEREYPRRYVREEQRRDDRFLDARDYAPKAYASRELVPRARQDSDLSVEEIRRDFPPPSARDARRTRSAEPGYYEAEYDYYRRGGHDSRYDGDHDGHARRAHGPSSRHYQDEHQRKPRPKSMTKQDKLIAAVAGAALLVGGKELYDRHEAKTDGADVQRNPLSSAALAGFGALAGYQGAEFYSKQQAQKDQTATYILHRGREGHVSEYYSDDQEDAPLEKKGRRNFLENAIAATGLGAAVKSLTGAGDDRRSDTRSRRGDSPSGSRAPAGANKMQKAAMASLLAGATEAFRVAKEPGGWKGEKTKRVLTAAAAAATVDAAQGDGHSGLGLAESVIGGLVGNRLINGSKKDIEEDKLTGRSRSRSRAPSRSHGAPGGSGGPSGPSGLAALATAGLGALGAKKVLDRSRSRSRGRDYDSRSPSPDGRRQRSRSRSVVDKARNSLAKLGIGSGSVEAADEHRRRDQDDFDDRSSTRRSRRYSDNMYEEDGHGRARGGYEPERPRRRRDSSRRRGSSRSAYDSDSDLGDSEEDEKRAKKMRGKQVLTTGLATIATIHAAHGVYQSMEKRRCRQRAVQEGRMSPDEAKKLKTKAVMQDAAAVGIAALGIKGALGEMKEAKEMGHECKEFRQEKVRRHERREQRRMRQHRGLDDGDRRADSVPARSRSRYHHADFEPDDGYGPRYIDDNPYSAARLPAPPMGRAG